MGAAAGVRGAAGAEGTLSAAEQPCDSRTIDRCIENLGSASDRERAVDELVALGEPALRRLIELYYGDVSVPKGACFKDQYNGEFNALARLTKGHLELALELVRRRSSVPLPVVAAFSHVGR
jgi:hypothetical protein